MTAMIPITSILIHSLRRIIISLALTMGRQTQQQRFYVQLPPISGRRLGLRQNITTIQLKQVDPKQIKSSCETSKILLAIKTYLLFMWIQPQRHLKLRYDKKIYPYLTRTTMCYLGLRYVLSSLEEKT